MTCKHNKIGMELCRECIVKLKKEAQKELLEELKKACVDFAGGKDTLEDYINRKLKKW